MRSQNKVCIFNELGLAVASRGGRSLGNLSRQLQILEKAGYVAIEKRFKGKYPQTICGMTKKGREALDLYAQMLKQVSKVTEGAKG